MKTWEKVTVGIVVLLLAYYIYTNYMASPTGPTGNPPVVGDNGLPSDGGMSGYNPNPTGPLGNPLGHPQLPIIQPTAPIIPRGSGTPSAARLAAQADVRDYAIALSTVNQYQTLNPTSLVPGTGPGGAYITPSPEVIVTAAPVNTTDHSAVATVHPLLNGKRH